MQRTTKYKFNLIETSDVFNPDALNANARTAEVQLAVVRDNFGCISYAGSPTPIWGKNSVTWYANNVNYQGSAAGGIYRWLAIGESLE